jgi:hypothetical protein
VLVPIVNDDPDVTYGPERSEVVWAANVQTQVPALSAQLADV